MFNFKKIGDNFCSIFKFKKKFGDNLHSVFLGKPQC